MKKTKFAAIALAGLSPFAVGAQDFGVMQSAEIIKPGNTKIAVYPMFIDGGNGSSNDTGFVARLGYGFTQNFDAEIKYASYDNIDFFGADGELGLVQNRPFDVSVSFGASFGSADQPFSDTTSIGAGLSLSGRVAQKLELGGTLNFNRIKLDDAGGNGRDHFNQIHLVPGLEYRLTDTIDVLAEFGLDLNDEATDYFAAGLAFYL